MWQFIVLFSCYFTCCTHAFGLFDSLYSEEESCHTICSNIYPPHTYENAFHSIYCQRGCRLFGIIDSVGIPSQTNQTVKDCYAACQESYPNTEDHDACSTGCDTKAESSDKIRKKFAQVMSEDDPLSPVFPLLYAQNIFSDMFDEMSRHMSSMSSSMSSSITFHRSINGGGIIVVQSEPEIGIVVDEVINFADDEDYKTSNYLETNLASVDNSATPRIFRNNFQLHPLVARDLDSDVSMSLAEDNNTDWLGCIAKKTGLPRTLLTLTIFMSAVVMIWLCFTTAATSQEQRLPVQKLSIYGDMQYLCTTKGKRIMISEHHPQQSEEQDEAKLSQYRLVED